jgi:hypothetical protein
MWIAYTVLLYCTVLLSDAADYVNQSSQVRKKLYELHKSNNN